MAVQTDVGVTVPASAAALESGVCRCCLNVVSASHSSSDTDCTVTSPLQVAIQILSPVGDMIIVLDSLDQTGIVAVVITVMMGLPRSSYGHHSCSPSVGEKIDHPLL